MARRAPLPASRPLDLLPSGRWTLVTAAFLLGLVLFVVVWLRVRTPAIESDASVQPVAMQAPIAPLPAPMPAGAATPLPTASESAQVVDEPAPEPVTALEQAPLPPNVEEEPSGQSSQTAVPAAPIQAAVPPQRLPGQPSPAYPPSALRRGETGTVVVQVSVGADGRPAALSISQRSGSRDLDRAAFDAVSRWRFEPARDAAGQPVEGSISVPIDFKTE